MKKILFIILLACLVFGANEALATTENSAVVKYNFTSFLSTGMSGEEVKQLQFRLQELGYLAKNIKATGYFGPATKTAVIRLQQEHKLQPQFGFVGPGTRKVLNTRVTPVLETPVLPTIVANNDPSYQIKRQILSKKSVDAVGGEVIKLIVAWQNRGATTWTEYKLSTTESQFADTSWSIADVIITGKEEVLPNEFLRRELYFRAPPQTGQQTFNFNLEIDGGKATEIVSVLVNVIASAPAGYKIPFSTNTTELQKSSAWIGQESRIRVGMAAPESNFIQFRSYEDDYRVFAGTEEKGILPVRKFAVIKFENGQYHFSGSDLDFSSALYIRLEPINSPHSVFHVPNLLSRTASWVGPNKYFNYYRGALEYRQGEIDKKMYIVNDLLLEDYVKGIAENSSIAPVEFVKANLVAARSYAYVSRGKYPFFDVLGNTYDQLYLGYEVESILANVQEAAVATRGVMVTYDGKVVVTPYFGNSNGSTKSWSSVWGGTSRPWLVPVVANYDAGKKMNGHGVGMSQLDAFFRVRNEGLNFIEVLKYYYTGVEVEKIYD